MSAPSRDELITHLLEHRIAGDVRTSRQSNLRNVERMLDGDPLYVFGLQIDAQWTPASVLAVMAARVGVSADPDHREGADRIDPELTMNRLDAMRDELRAVAARRGRVVLASGHPTGIVELHLAIARALRAAGCHVLLAGAGETYERHLSLGQTARREIRYIGGVAMVSDGASLKHTHAPDGMQTILRALAAAGEPPPDLVVADHGYAGAAGQAGVRTVGFADSNDPALFVGEATGQVAVAVPLDDNVLPHLYEPLARYVIDGL